MTAAVLNKVLIVDDDPDILRLLTAFLKKGGYEVSTASNGVQALELAEKEQPSYLITDWEMPEMSGLELCRQVRQLKLDRYLFIVFLTGRSHEDDLVAAMDAGADDFLSKPPRRHELLARMTAGARVLHLESHLSRLASHDALTGLLTRRAFADSTEKEWSRSARYRLPLSAVMLDIDYFKQVNDTYGHPAGDEVIRRVAELIRQSSRNSDVVCRYGGEEFCVLLPETDEASATLWAERLRSIIANETISVGTTDLKVTVSLGVAEMLADMEDDDQLITMADECLLAAKQQGRNRVVSLQVLTESGCLTIDGDTDAPVLDGVRARDAMIPLSHSLRRDWPVVRAASYFLQFRISSAPVTDASGNLLGVVSEKDVLAVVHTSDVADRVVNEIMRTNVVTYDVNAPLSRILSFLTRASMRSVMVTSDGKPCGLVSRAAIVRWFVERHWNSHDSTEPTIEFADTAADSDVEPTMLNLVQLLVDEVDQLRRFVQKPDPDHDTAPIVGGASRIQQLTDDLLAGSANRNRTGG